MELKSTQNIFKILFLEIIKMPLKIFNVIKSFYSFHDVAYSSPVL